jgi:hypothetical protein
MSECGRGMLNHDIDCIVRLIIVGMHVNSLTPEAHLFASSQDLEDIHLLEVLSAMFHDFLWLIVGVENCEFGEDPHMCSLHSQSVLKQLHHFFLSIVLLVLLDKRFKQVRNNDDILSSN